MKFFSLVYMFSFVFFLTWVRHDAVQVEASIRMEREVETAEEDNQLGKVQQQLLTVFDSLKKSMEELASKLNTDDIVQGVQNLTSKLEIYAKQAADQFASTASGNTNVDQKKEETS